MTAERTEKYVFNTYKNKKMKKKTRKFIFTRQKSISCIKLNKMYECTVND